MENVTNIRNVSVIGQVNHGKSTLANTLASIAGIPTTPRVEGSCCSTVNDDNEKDYDITIKPVVFPLYFNVNEDDVGDIQQKSNGSAFMINLVDSPGHVDLLPEATAALGITDGALMVVDCIEGICHQTEVVLRQALIQRINPVIVINKIDHAIFLSHHSTEDLYQSFKQTVESVNTIVTIYGDKSLGDLMIHPEKGSVAFASGLQGWAFTIPLFADRYAKKFGVDRQKMAAKLWGDNYFNSATKKWTKQNTTADGKLLERAFNVFILDVIFKISNTVMNNTMDNVLAMLVKLQVELTPDEMELQGKPLLKTILNKYLPVGDVLMRMAVIHLPSPITAQQHRVNVLYEDHLDEECATGIRDCNPNGPLMLYVSRMVPSSDKRHFYALGRVFSGTVRYGLSVRIQGPGYVSKKKNDLFVKSIERVVLLTGAYVQPVESCPAGNIIGLLGIDQFLLQSGTITTSETAHNLKVIKTSVTPIVQITVESKDPSHMPKLVEGLKRLSKSDPSVHCYTSDTGEHIVASCGEIHLEDCLKDLEENCAQVPIQKSNPYIQYRETVTIESPDTVLAKSPNKHNRLFLRAAPLTEEVSRAIEDGTIHFNAEPKARAHVLSEKYEWDNTEARKIWSFGPNNSGPNVLVDMTKGVPYLQEIKDACRTAFQWVTRESVFAQEEMRACRFNVMDVCMFSDAIHRGSGQIIPTCRRAVFASMMISEPRFMEPMYLVDIRIPMDAMEVVYGIITTRRGQVLSEINCPRTTTSICRVQVYVPVAESFGLMSELREATGGQASVQSVFDHWKMMQFGMDHPDTQKLIMDIRERKGLKLEMPKLETFQDRL
ncbi:Elongation factor 2 [Modicella reniformis]|uniref:Elongation factor 2 n=1 Tax=Modicella reniformis TaxID=1440133 RepID=A0A9P6M9G5_9FUNG|nr:Elongation factor 2 [Modicella reniformis]